MSNKENATYIGKRIRRKTIKEAKQRLFSPSEQLLCAIRGGVETTVMSAKSSSQIVFLLVTNERVIFYMPKILGGFNFESYPYTQISSVVYKKGSLMDKLTLILTSHDSNKKVIKWIPKGDGQIPSEIIRERIMTSMNSSTRYSNTIKHDTPTDSGTTFCPECGSPVSADAKFCPFCGHMLHD